MIRDRVHRLRTTAAPGRAAQARLRSERRLADLDSTRLGFGQAAIVCVRRLRLEGSWPDLRSGAVRPVFDDTGADRTDVVWFQDGAELLACLARDAGTDRLDRWWWRLLLGAAPARDRVAERFLEDPASARAALERIRTSGAFGQFLSFLGEARVAVIAEATGTSLPPPVGAASGSAEVRHASQSPSSSSPRSEAAEPSSHRSAERSSEGDPMARGTLLDPTGLPPGPPPECRSTPRPPLLAKPGGNTPTGAPTSAISSESKREVLAREELVAQEVSSGSETDRAPTNLRRIGSPTTGSSDPGTAPGGPMTTDSVITSEPRTEIASAVPTHRSDLAPEETESVSDRSHPVGSEQSGAKAPLASPEALELETGFGGLLFVLDALLAMGWVPDFTRPLDPGVGIAPLEYLLRLGVHRFGRRFAEDALHGWLAGQMEKVPRLPPPRLDELETRISHALGMRPRRAMHLLCRRRARLSVASGRVDASFPLHDHPLEIRLAGLDRDPGWIPTAGWDFRFHFPAERP